MLYEVITFVYLRRITLSSQFQQNQIPVLKLTGLVYFQKVLHVLELSTRHSIRYLTQVS